MAAIQISMDVSAHKVGCDLGQLWPICNMLVPLELRFEPEPIYRPRISAHSSPYALYLPVFYSKLDMDISVGVRRVAKSHRCAAPGGTLYSIREYLAEPNGETLHPIQGLLGLFSTWGLHQRQVKHLLLPIQCFLDVDKRLFYTVSEDAYLTLEGLLGGLKQWSHGSDEGYFALCHDEIWSIMHQVLTGLEVLVSRGLQHENLSLRNILITRNGVVKIGAIHHITKEASEGWTHMRKALQELAYSLIKGSEHPCSPCAIQCRENDTDPGRCASKPKRGQFCSFIDSLHESPLLVEAGVAGVISQTKRVDFIHEAKGLRLGALVELVAANVFRGIVPVRAKLPGPKMVSTEGMRTVAPDTSHSPELATTDNITGR